MNTKVTNDLVVGIAHRLKHPAINFTGQTYSVSN